jgi:hypothetical protein
VTTDRALRVGKSLPRFHPMIILSFKAREVGVAHKRLVLKILIKVYKPNIILIKEIMCVGSKSIYFFASFVEDWSFSSLDVGGQSSGLVIGWGPHFVALTTLVIRSGIKVNLFDKELDKELIIINLYGLYLDKHSFWENLAFSGELRGPDLIIGGDLNLTISLEEVWGVSVRQYPVSKFFVHLFDTNQLVDMEPIKLIHMWRNVRSGDEAISKRLDKF